MKVDKIKEEIERNRKKISAYNKFVYKMKTYLINVYKGKRKLKDVNIKAAFNIKRGFVIAMTVNGIPVILTLISPNERYDGYIILSVDGEIVDIIDVYELMLSTNFDGERAYRKRLRRFKRNLKNATKIASEKCKRINVVESIKRLIDAITVSDPRLDEVHRRLVIPKTLTDDDVNAIREYIMMKTGDRKTTIEIRKVYDETAAIVNVIHKSIDDEVIDNFDYTIAANFGENVVIARVIKYVHGKIYDVLAERWEKYEDEYKVYNVVCSRNNINRILFEEAKIRTYETKRTNYDPLYRLKHMCGVIFTDKAIKYVLDLEEKIGKKNFL